MPSVQNARPIAAKKGSLHAGKKESLVGLAAAAACCMVGSTGGGLPLEAGHEITALLDALNSALAEPFALAWVSNSPRFLLVFTVIYAVALL